MQVLNVWRIELNHRVIVPVSGGKDSQACVAWALEHYEAERILMVHQDTGFDHSLTYAHMRYMEERYKVPLLSIKGKYKDVPDTIIGEGIIPTRFARACTKQLKMVPWFNWLKSQPDHAELLVLLGMRAQESTRRMQNYRQLSGEDEFTQGDISSDCPASVRAIRVRLPIVNWSTTTTFDYLRKRGDKINPLYARGHSRVGCYPCVLAGKRDFTLAARDPEGREHLDQLESAMMIVRLNKPEIDFDGLFEHDIPALLDKKDADPFGFNDPDDNCSWCSM